MDYQKIYNQIVERGKLRIKPEGYFESHHILPRCLGGGDEPENLVNLTGREHFICHWLLIRIHVGNKKIVCAFWFMCNNKTRRKYIPSSRTYQESKELLSIISDSLETREKKRLGSTNRVLSEESRRLIGLAQVGRVHTEEHKKKNGDGNRGKKRSIEFCKRNSEIRLGTKQSEEHRKKNSQARKDYWQKRRESGQLSSGRIYSDETRKLISEGNRRFQENKRKNVSN